MAIILNITNNNINDIIISLFFIVLNNIEDRIKIDSQPIGLLKSKEPIFIIDNERVIIKVGNR